MVAPMFALLLLAFTVVPAIELYLLISVGAKIGGFNTIAIVIATGIVGAALAKSQGLAVLQKIQDNLAQGQLPTGQILHGLLIFGGGLLLLTPGFLTDLLGLSMVFPGTRFAWVMFLKNRFKKGIQKGNIHFYSSTTSTHADSNSKAQHEPRVDDNTFEAQYEVKDE